MEGTDLNYIYRMRHDFTIVALTGNIGSGCDEVASRLTNGFDNGQGLTHPNELFRRGKSRFIHNAFRKHRIIYEYAEKNFEPYAVIEYRDILTLLLLQKPFDELKDFLRSSGLNSEFSNSNFPPPDFTDEVEELEKIRPLYETVATKYHKIDIDKLKDNNNWDALSAFFFDDEDFRALTERIHGVLGRTAELDPHRRKPHSGLKYHKTFQVVANNLRKTGEPFYTTKPADTRNIFIIAEVINKIIKSYRKQHQRAQLVINSIKSPVEVSFFRERYAAFYLVAINRKEDQLSLGRFSTSKAKKYLAGLMEEEYKGGKDSEFFRLKVSQCVQLADIHLSFFDDNYVNTKLDAFFDENNNRLSVSSPIFGWQDQLLKFISVIDHPGLVTPSPEERCMQLAFTAKHNSGCISRHVGAAVTDENFSVRAIGWNNTPEGQVPCVLRNAEDLINKRMDLDAFTDYERDHDNEKFNNALEQNFKQRAVDGKDRLQGRHVCFCFKSLKNSFEEGKNQVHTRSLHAEENAFLQVSKHGGLGVQNGKLFSTASPCELCAKKARQLGIKEIYYIDPYPSISNSHILNTNSNPIEPKLFNGIIGSAYHLLYNPMMAYKDELTMILDNPIIDIASKYKSDLLENEKKMKQKEAELTELRKELETLKAKGTLR